jgi:hypothetical protein
MAKKGQRASAKTRRRALTKTIERASSKETTPPSRRTKPAIAAVPVSSRNLAALKRELERRMKNVSPLTTTRSKARRGPAAKYSNRPARWNPDPEDVQKSVAQLVLTIVEFLRQLMERQAIRRMQQKTLTKKQVEDIGIALMRLEETVLELGKRFGLTAEDLNLDLGPIKLI